MRHMTSAANVMLRTVLGAAILIASVDGSWRRPRVSKIWKKYQESAACSSGHVSRCAPGVVRKAPRHRQGSLELRRRAVVTRKRSDSVRTVSGSDRLFRQARTAMDGEFPSPESRCDGATTPRCGHRGHRRSEGLPEWAVRAAARSRWQSDRVVGAQTTCAALIRR